jgi:NAD-dependent SIR2 family protein deacetylase
MSIPWDKLDPNEVVPAVGRSNVVYLVAGRIARGEKITLRCGHCDTVFDHTIIDESGCIPRCPKCGIKAGVLANRVPPAVDPSTVPVEVRLAEEKLLRTIFGEEE